MKQSAYIYFFICLTVALTFYKFSRGFNTNEYRSHPHLEICRKPNRIYHGPSLTSRFNDTKDLVLCPGDTFGDLTETFIRLDGQESFLTMHCQGKILWSSEKSTRSNDEGFSLCAASLERDGNLVIYKESLFPNSPYQKMFLKWPAWESHTGFHPNKTEVRIRDQQLQIVHTLQDESKRMFYIGADIIRGRFREYLGAPRQIAKEFFIINHSNDSNDSTILRRNEYIGDLNNIHLIFQTNCELQLLNKTQLLWSFAAAGFELNHNCTLGIEEQNSIGISGMPDTRQMLYGAMKILLYTDFNVLQSNITLQGDQLLVIQTLKDGSQVTFYSEPGQDNGLKLKKELKQIAKNSISIPSKTEVFLKRMEYIGDLDGLHLKLQNNCDFVLANGKLNLWKSQIIADPPYMECFITFNWFKDGTIKFSRTKNNRGPVDGEGRFIFDQNPPVGRDHSEKFQLSLENNLMIINLKYSKKAPEVYHAGLNTNGTWFQFLSDHSLTVKASAKKDKIFPEMGYIGDINGVYAILDKRGNWILFNKTRPIWESGTTQDYDSRFVLILTRDGNVAVSYEWKVQVKEYLWSTETTDSYKKAQLKKSELFVNPNGMWLAKTYIDGTVQKFKALEGTNRFAPVDEFGSPLSYFDKLLKKIKG